MFLIVYSWLMTRSYPIWGAQPLGDPRTGVCVLHQRAAGSLNPKVGDHSHNIHDTAHMFVFFKGRLSDITNMQKINSTVVQFPAITKSVEAWGSTSPLFWCPNYHAVNRVTGTRAPALILCLTVRVWSLASHSSQHLHCCSWQLHFAESTLKIFVLWLRQPIGGVIVPIESLAICIPHSNAMQQTLCFHVTVKMIVCCVRLVTGPLPLAGP